jgi:hypothetical protein
VLRFVASNSYQYVPAAQSGSSADVVRRSVQISDRATANAASLSYLIGTGAQDMIVKSTLGDVAFGARSAAQMSVNVAGGSVLTAKDIAVNLNNVYSGINRDAPSVARAAYLVQPVTITVAAPVSTTSAKGMPTYTYNSVTKTFSPVTAAKRSFTAGATTVIDVNAVSKQVAYFDSRGGFWMVA